MNKRQILFVLCFMSTTLLSSMSVTAHKPKPTPKERIQQQQPDEVLISAALAGELGIRVSTVSAGTIKRHIPLYGDLVLPARQQAQVRARFPGVIKQLAVSQGDRVDKGDQVALIESNDSLRTYPVIAPITGIVVQQFVAEGEFTSGEPLITVFDTRSLLAELKVFPSQLNEVKAGLLVHLETRLGRIDGRIEHLLPVVGQPFQLAQVMLDNSLGKLQVGEPLRALVDAEIISAALVVENQALQQYEGNAVVFVQSGEHFHPRTLLLGRTDGQVTEVLVGLTAGERYVVAQSYLLKAELEKSAVMHQH